MSALLDAQDPMDKAWTGFKLCHASATSLRLLLAELRRAAPDYLEQLPNRIADAVSHGYMWKEKGPPDGEPWDGYVPIQGPDHKSVTYVPFEEAELLESQLSLEAASPHDNLWLMRGQLVVSYHSALDVFARQGGVTHSKLPEGINTLLKTVPGAPLEVSTFLELVEFDATRHVFVHQAGIVDLDYQRAVRNSPLARNERRPVDDTLLDGYSRLVWHLGSLLCAAAATGNGAA